MSLNKYPKTILLQTEANYYRLFENNPMPMWVISMETFQFLDVNIMACLQYGYTREEFLAMSALDIRPEEEIENFLRLNRRGQIGQNNYNKGLWKHKKKDGSIIQVEVVSHEIELGGKPCKLVLSNDVTARLEAEEKLAASEKQLRYTLDSMMEGAQILDFNWKYVYVNDTLVATSKYTRDELLGSTITERFPGIEDTTVFKVMQECMLNRTSEHMENRFVFPDGSVNYYQLSIQPVPQGLFILSIDITQRVLAEQVVKESEQNLKSIFENVSEGFLLADADGNIRLLNDRIKEIIYAGSGHTIKAGDNIFNYVSPERIEFLRKVLQRVVSGEAVEYEREYNKSPDKKGWINLLFNPVIEEGEITGTCITSRDVTALKELEAEKARQQLEAQQKIAQAILRGQEKERNHIAREMHDNINQILAGARMYLSIAATKSEEVKEHVSYPIELLDKSVQEIRLLCSRMVSPLTSIGLKDLMHDLLSQLEIQAAISVEQQISADLDQLPDELKLNAYRILQELTNNIIKYAKATVVKVDVRIEDNLFIIKLKDNGQGFDVHAKKEGIGLANIRSRVLSFGGTIDIKSSAGKGSSTMIEIPV